jgi:uncharacterized protein YegP (UPF0339 family)
MQKINGRSQIEIRKAGSSEYYFIFKLPNDEIFISHFFEDGAEATSAAEKIKRSSPESSNYLCKKETSDQFYFVFNIKNNSAVGQSSIYKDRQSMDYGIKYMKEYLVEAEIVDLTT